MASSGYIQKAVTSWDTVRLSWSITEQSQTENKSTINWVLQLIAGSSGYISSSASKDYKVTINGTSYTGTCKIGISNNTTKTLASGSTVIAHNADGTKSFSYSFYQEIDITFSGTKISSVSQSGTGVLDLIPQKANITAANNFTDEDKPTITYTNTAGESVDSLQACISVDGETPLIEYRDIGMLDTTYTFEFTSAEKVALQAATPNSNTITVYFIIKTEIQGTPYYSKMAKVLTIANSKPAVFPIVYDTNESVIALTGNKNVLLVGHSNAYFSIGAAANKQATIASQKVTNTGVSFETATGTFEKVGSGVFVFDAVDSRGNATQYTLTKDTVGYIKLTCDLKAFAPTPDGAMEFEISGNYFNSSFGAVDNTLAVYYRYKTNSGEYCDWITLQPTVTNNRYTTSVVMTGLDYQNTYTIQAKAVDVLNTVNSVEKAVKTRPVFDWGRDDFKFNVPVEFTEDIIIDKPLNVEVDTTLNGTVAINGEATFDTAATFNGEASFADLTVFNYETTYNGEAVYNGNVTYTQPLDLDVNVDFNKEVTIKDVSLKEYIVDLLYPVGSIYISVNSVNPSTLFGGSWTQIEDKFILAAGSTYTGGSEGGKASYALSVAHKHTSPLSYNSTAVGGVNINGTVSSGSGKAFRTAKHDYTGTLSSNVTAYYTGNATVAATIPTIPPYLAVYVWERTA